MIEKGLLDGGRLIPGTDWILRDTEAWYSPGDDDVYGRASPPELVVYHWTAGPRRSGYAAAQKTYRAMQARRKDNGAEMSVSAQFVLSDDGLLTQLADLSLCCVHADRQFNLRGVSIEYAFPGTVKQAEKLEQPTVPEERRKVAEALVRCVVPSAAALATAVRFSELLAARYGIPRVSFARRSRFNAREMREAKGVCEHYHAVSTTKIDAAGYFVDAHVAAGWEAR